jgi:thiamine pyrophosphate-dependent acetolactate synthase large subunit-like protein
MTPPAPGAFEAAADARERPAGDPPCAPEYGSDVVAEALRATGIPYIALNPGASYRGFHDSLVNFLGNRAPQMLLCLHEEHAVHIAQGYAKATGEPLAVAVHSNVGLMHATMAMFNAWCDRMPVVVIGATGPVDAPKRRPWIDWIHTARDQGALVRGYVKWDDQPASPQAAREAVLRAYWLAVTDPPGPTYVNLDAGMQEAKLEAPLPPIEASRYLSRIHGAPAPADIERAAALLVAAKRPLILAGRVSRSLDAWHARIALAERLGARVVTDLKVGAAFPTMHPLHVDAPGVLLRPAVARAIADADVILSLDYVDLAGILQASCGGECRAKVIQVSLDHHLHGGWSMDYQGHPPVDCFVAATPDAAVPLLLEACGKEQAGRGVAGAATNSAAANSGPGPQFTPAAVPEGAIGVDDVALALRNALGGRPASLSHLPLSWDGASWPFAHPLDFLGSDGGGGIGAGPGIAVGAALALRDAGAGRLPIAVCGDGDFIMGATAVWTAVHYRIPMLLVVVDNRSFYNDEVHQERVARMRNRPVENKWIGQRISEPDVDCAALARAQGALGIGPVSTREEMADAFTDAIAAVEAGRIVVVDVRVTPAAPPGATPVAAGSKPDRG